MSLLGDSQTFLGTLTSLIALCILFNTNNFIKEILRKISKNIDKDIKELNNSINIDEIYNKNVIDSSNYSKLLKFIEEQQEKDKKKEEQEQNSKTAEAQETINEAAQKLTSNRRPNSTIETLQEKEETVVKKSEHVNVENKTDNNAQNVSIETRQKRDKKLLNDALECKMTLLSTFNAIKAKYSFDFLSALRGSIKKVREAKEIIISPLYSLMTCLLLFICDEILNEFSQTKPVIFCSLTIFIAISYLYCLILWGRFLNIMLFRKTTKESSNDETTKENLTKSFCKRLNGVYSCILIIAIFINFTIVSTSIIVESRYSVYCIVYLLGIFMPIITMAYFRIKSNNRFDEKKYRFALKHFIYFMVISASYTIIIVLLNALSIDIPLLEHNWHNFIKHSALFFILLNGIILPFLIPYYCLKRIENSTIKDMELVKTNINKETNDAKKLLDEFVNRINNLN